MTLINILSSTIVKKYFCKTFQKSYFQEVEKGGYVYIMTNKHKTVLYIGITSDLKKRVWEHKNHVYPKSFTDRYNLEYLIYYEGFFHIEEAILREKQLKRWNREKKNNLINRVNPYRNTLNDEIMNDVYSLFE